MRVLFGQTWIAQSDDVVLLHEPGRYPVAYFPRGDIAAAVLQPTDRTTTHGEFGTTTWYAVSTGEHEASRAAWEHIDLPAFAAILRERVAFVWHAMDAFYEEDERILGHAADAYHRIDIRQTSRELIVRAGDQLIAESHRPLVLYESGFAPRWYVPREDTDEAALRPVERQTFCPYRGLCSYYDIGERTQAGWSYRKCVPRGRPHLRPDLIRARQGHRADRRRRAGARARAKLALSRDGLPIALSCGRAAEHAPRYP